MRSVLLFCLFWPLKVNCWAQHRRDTTRAEESLGLFFCLCQSQSYPSRLAASETFQPFSILLAAHSSMPFLHCSLGTIRDFQIFPGGESPLQNHSCPPQWGTEWDMRQNFFKACVKAQPSSIIYLVMVVTLPSFVETYLSGSGVDSKVLKEVIHFYSEDLKKLKGAFGKDVLLFFPNGGAAITPTDSVGPQLSYRTLLRRHSTSLRITLTGTEGYESFSAQPLPGF